MPPQKFARAAHAVVDWIANQMRTRADERVLAETAPGATLARLPMHAPAQGESLEAVTRDFLTLFTGGVTQSTHPAFFAYFSGSSSGPGIVGELLTAATNANTMLWRTGPSAVELEEAVCRWVSGMLHLNPTVRGMITEGGSISALHAVLAAREHALPDVVRRDGLSGLPRLRIYGSTETHSSMDKAAIAAGLGMQSVRRVACAADGRVDAGALRRAIAEDRAAGMLPMMLVGTAGSTSTGTMESLAELADVAAAERIWFHVDASYGGAAAMLPEMAQAFRGWERADSVVVNPHKWMFVPIGCSILFFANRETMRRAISHVPDYLERPTDEADLSPMDYGLALGRRANAVKLYFALRTFGVDGLRERIRAHIGAARELAGLIEGHPDFELLAPVHLSVVAFRFRPRKAPEDELDALNAALLDRLNAGGSMYLSQTRVNGRYALRLAINNLATTRADVLRAWEGIQQTANARREKTTHA